LLIFFSACEKAMDAFLSRVDEAAAALAEGLAKR
jgi:hypothetical protein